MREDGEWGGNLELVAAARLYRYVRAAFASFSLTGVILSHSTATSMNSRNITVFSADLAAFTIPHGGSKTAGPDLLVSYHDNDHYNSVRSTSSAGKNGFSNGFVGDEDSPQTKKENGNSKKSGNNAKDGNGSPAQSNAKKSAPCPCGSGQKYKKCCLKREKHAARVKKIQGDANSDNEDDQSVDAKVCSGFRVMKI